MARANQSPLDDHLRRTAGVYRYLNQGEIWCPKPPANPLPISGMDLEWRYNAAQFLMRRAPSFLHSYDWGEFASLLATDAPDDVQNDAEHWEQERRSDPAAWMRGTALFRALVVDLPAKRTDMARLADAARHYSTCGARNSGPCTCDTTAPVDTAIAALIRATAKDLRAPKMAKKAKRRREAGNRAERSPVDLPLSAFAVYGQPPEPVVEHDCAG